jgi:SiaC family regulatory phosphoprotein
MNSLVIYPSQDTPEIQFHSSGNLTIKGISIPENVHGFYKEVFDWLDNFKHQLPPKVTLNLQLEYMNTSSIKSVVSLIKVLINCCKDRTELVVNWICDPDDDELIEEGELLQECVNLEFCFIPSSED